MIFPFSFWPTSGPPPFDPAVLALSLWLRDHPASAPWNGTASAGSSGSHNIGIAGFNSGVGTPLSTHTTALYDGTSANLDDTDDTADNLISNGAWSASRLFKPDSAAADGGNAYQSAQLLTTSATAIWGISYSASGFSAWQYDGAWKLTPYIAAATGAFYAVQAKYDGTTLKCRVNGGARQTVAVTAGFGGFTLTTNKVRLGYSSFGGGVPGTLADQMLSQTTLSDADEDNIYSYYKTRYPAAGLP